MIRRLYIISMRRDDLFAPLIHRNRDAEFMPLISLAQRRFKYRCIYAQQASSHDSHRFCHDDMGSLSRMQLLWFNYAYGTVIRSS